MQCNLVKKHWAMSTAEGGKFPEFNLFFSNNWLLTLCPLKLHPSVPHYPSSDPSLEWAAGGSSPTRESTKTNSSVNTTVFFPTKSAPKAQKNHNLDIYHIRKVTRKSNSSIVGRQIKRRCQQSVF